MVLRDLVSRRDALKGVCTALLLPALGSLGGLILEGRLPGSPHERRFHKHFFFPLENGRVARDDLATRCNIERMGQGPYHPDGHRVVLDAVPVEDLPWLLEPFAQNLPERVPIIIEPKKRPSYGGDTCELAFWDGIGEVTERWP